MSVEKGIMEGQLNYSEVFKHLSPSPLTQNTGLLSPEPADKKVNIIRLIYQKKQEIQKLSAPPGKDLFFQKRDKRISILRNFREGLKKMFFGKKGLFINQDGLIKKEFCYKEPPKTAIKKPTIRSNSTRFSSLSSTAQGFSCTPILSPEKKPFKTLYSKFNKDSEVFTFSTPNKKTRNKKNFEFRKGSDYNLNSSSKTIPSLFSNFNTYDGSPNSNARSIVVQERPRINLKKTIQMTTIKSSKAQHKIFQELLSKTKNIQSRNAKINKRLNKFAKSNDAKEVIIPVNLKKDIENIMDVKLQKSKRKIKWKKEKKIKLQGHYPILEECKNRVALSLDSNHGVINEDKVDLEKYCIDCGVFTDPEMEKYNKEKKELKDLRNKFQKNSEILKRMAYNLEIKGNKFFNSCE